MHTVGMRNAVQGNDLKSNIYLPHGKGEGLMEGLIKLLYLLYVHYLSLKIILIKSI